MGADRAQYMKERARISSTGADLPARPERQPVCLEGKRLQRRFSNPYWTVRRAAALREVEDDRCGRVADSKWPTSDPTQRSDSHCYLVVDQWDDGDFQVVKYLR